MYEERDIKSKIINKSDDSEEEKEDSNEEIEEKVDEPDDVFVTMREVSTDKIHVDPSEEQYGEKIFDIEEDPDALETKSDKKKHKEESIDEIETIFDKSNEVSEENDSEEEKVEESSSEEKNDEENTSEEESTDNVEEKEESSQETEVKEEKEEVNNTDPNNENTVYDIPKIISSEEYVLENTQEPEDAYTPFVRSDEIVPLPPKKTILFRIKDFYNSWFEGYEKAEEIKVDDREARLTLDKIYDNNSKKFREKRIHMNDVVMIWLVCFVLSFFSFFVFTCISFITDIAFGSHNNVPLLMYIIPFFQIGIPTFLMTCGWLLGIVYSFIKHTKKSNR